MTELRGGREFGRGTLIGNNGDDFFDEPLARQVTDMGWSHACPVVNEVVAEYGAKWTLKRYAECNFVFGIFVEAAKKLNPSLHTQLTSPVERIAGEKPGEGQFNPDLVPNSFYTEMPPLTTPWGYALPRAIIEQMGRGENNIERTPERILQALDVIDETVKTSSNPVELLVKVAEKVSSLDANPKTVLSHVLSNGILKEEGCETMYKEIKNEIDRSAPTLKETYNSLSPSERKSVGVINL